MANPKFYLYDSDTGEYKGEVDVEKCPIKGEYLPPSNATTMKPPSVGKNEVAVFENGKWMKKANYVGVTYWYDHSRSETINRIGVVVPDGCFLERPDVPFDIMKQRKIEEFDNKFVEELTSRSGPYHRIEAQTWDMQAKAAKDFLNGERSPLIDAMAQERGIDAKELAEKIIDKHDSYQRLVGELLGKKRKLIAQIEAVAPKSKTNASLKKAVKDLEAITW